MGFHATAVNIGAAHDSVVPTHRTAPTVRGTISHRGEGTTRQKNMARRSQTTSPARWEKTLQPLNNPFGQKCYLCLRNKPQGQSLMWLTGWGLQALPRFR